jgi:hypothetical protein
MLLNEFIYFNKDDRDMEADDRYDPFKDTSVLKQKDVRKTRLTLRQINDLRMASEAREKETKEDLVIIRQMYAPPQTEEAAPAQ